MWFDNIYGITPKQRGELNSNPSKHKTFPQCWFIVGQPSTELAQHYFNIGLTFRVCRCSRFSVPPFQHTGGYVDTSFSLPGGTLKLEKGQFQVPSPGVRLPPPPGGYVEASFGVPGDTLKLGSAYRGVR